MEQEKETPCGIEYEQEVAAKEPREVSRGAWEDPASLMMA